MNEHIIKRVRRDIEAARKGVQAGMPKIRIDCNDAERLCAEIERLTRERDEIIERCAEVCDKEAGQWANAVHIATAERCAAAIRALK